MQRLRRYESLLQENNIDFQSLNTPAADEPSPSVDGRASISTDDAPSEGHAAGPAQRSKKKTAVKTETVYKAKLCFPQRLLNYLTDACISEISGKFSLRG